VLQNIRSLLFGPHDEEIFGLVKAFYRSNYVTVIQFFYKVNFAEDFLEIFLFHLFFEQNSDSSLRRADFTIFAFTDFAEFAVVYNFSYAVMFLEFVNFVYF
jgi:hypothetical protein